MFTLEWKEQVVGRTVAVCYEQVERVEFKASAGEQLIDNISDFVRK